MEIGFVFHNCLLPGVPIVSDFGIRASDFRLKVGELALFYIIRLSV